MALPQENEKFAPPPPNIAIRTMAKDLVALRTGGGTIPELAPQEPTVQPSPEEAFLYPQSTPRAAGPEVPPLPPLVESPPPSESASTPGPTTTTAHITEVKKTLRTGKVYAPPIVISLAAVVVILGMAAFGYFVIYPWLEARFHPASAPLVTLPSPSPSLLPSPTLSQINPAILLAKPPLATVTIALSATTSEELLGALEGAKAPTLSPGSLKTIAVTDPDGTYLSPKDFVTRFVQNPPPSFTASLGAHYLPFLYFAKTDPQFGAAFEILPGARGSVMAILQSWETANIDHDWAYFFLGQNPGARVASNFSTVVINGIAIREVAYRNNNLRLDYASSGNTLVIATGREALLALLKSL